MSDDEDSTGGGKQARKRARRAAKRRARDASGEPAGEARPARTRAPGSKRLAPPPLAENPPSQGPDARSGFFDLAFHHAPVVGVETPHGSFVIATGDRHLGKSLFVKQSRPEFRVLARVVTTLETLIGEGAVAGRTFIDIGANVGTSSVVALLTHGFGDVVCCEPEPNNYRLLRANLALNGLEERAQTFQAGASDEIGTATLVVHEESGGFSWVAADADRIAAMEQARKELVANDPSLVLPGMSSVTIETLTVDALIERTERPPEGIGLLWIDAEGHEDRILRGAGRLTEAGVPLVIEFDPRGQRERGDPDNTHEVAEASYTHFVDVRRRQVDPAEARFQLRPVGELRALAERFLDPSSPTAFTDVLLLRLTDEQAAGGADLAAVFEKHGRAQGQASDADSSAAESAADGSSAEGSNS